MAEEEEYICDRDKVFCDISVGIKQNSFFKGLQMQIGGSNNRIIKGGGGWQE